jgi:hypothetical protein
LEIVAELVLRPGQQERDGPCPGGRVLQQFLNFTRGLVESWAFILICCQQRFPTENARALRLKKGAQFIRKMRITAIKPSSRRPLGLIVFGLINKNSQSSGVHWLPRPNC